MSKIFLIDDDSSVTNILKIIIEDKELGTVCGISQSPEDALEDLSDISPDVVIVDLLMPKMDGISFVKKAKTVFPDASYVMLSQVSSKDMIVQAYDAGIDFFIQKPISSIEVCRVIENVLEKQHLQKTVNQIQNIFSNNSSNQAKETPENDLNKKLEYIFRDIGISGEAGCRDIAAVVSYLYKHDDEDSELTIKEVCSRLSDAPKSVEQRIRRTAAVGLSFMANIGLVDFGNLIFNEYSGTLYSFEQVRKEMDYIQGKSTQHGSVKIRKFISAFLNMCKIR
jgi:two-component system response regulator YcbB